MSLFWGKTGTPIHNSTVTDNSKVQRNRFTNYQQQQKDWIRILTSNLFFYLFWTKDQNIHMAMET